MKFKQPEGTDKPPSPSNVKRRFGLKTGQKKARDAHSSSAFLMA
jgi:hypothetical protein